MSGEIIDKFPSSLTVVVRPNSKKNEYLGKDEQGRYRIAIKEKAEDNKANVELIKFFKKEFGTNVRILKGLKTKQKILRLVV